MISTLQPLSQIVFGVPPVLSRLDTKSHGAEVLRPNSPYLKRPVLPTFVPLTPQTNGWIHRRRVMVSDQTTIHELMNHKNEAGTREAEVEIRKIGA